MYIVILRGRVCEYVMNSTVPRKCRKREDYYRD